MLNAGKYFVIDGAAEDFNKGISNAIVITRQGYEDGIKRSEVFVTGIKEYNQRLNDEMTEMDLYESQLDEVESMRRLSVLPAIEELEELLRTESDLMKKKNLITLIDNLLWTEQQIMKIKEA